MNTRLIRLLDMRSRVCRQRKLEEMGRLQRRQAKLERAVGRQAEDVPDEYLLRKMILNKLQDQIGGQIGLRSAEVAREESVQSYLKIHMDR